MRIQILSDLHVDYKSFALPQVKADVTVLAGDVRRGKLAFAWIRENCPERPVVYVLGNHEFYGGAIPKLINDFRRMSRNTNIHILENESICVDGIRFLGCTLWTDFRLFGDPTIAGRNAATRMNDYLFIRVSPEFRRLKGMDTARFHAHSVRWLQEQLDTAGADHTVVVTHHAPSARSLHPEEAEDLIGAAYASNLEDLIISTRPTLWIHGHIHRRVDYCIGETRIVSNPRGYAYVTEPTDFDPGFDIDL